MQRRCRGQEEIKTDDLLRRPPDGKSQNGKTCSLFSKKTAWIDKKKSFLSLMQMFHSPSTLPLVPFSNLLGSSWQPWALSWKSHFDLFCSIRHICAKMCVFMWFITFLIRKRINMITVRFIIRTNGISYTTEKGTIAGKCLPVKIHTWRYEKVLINAEYTNEYTISWCSID